jgi:1-acyl-sn-glycerol-3-phosphate acyltransferase
LQLFRKFWAIYAVTLFLLLMLVSLPVLGANMVLNPGKTALKRNIFYLHHIFSPIFFALIGVRLRITGREHLDRNTSYVIVGNHRSALDFIINAMAFPGVFRFLAKQELLRIPIFGWVVRKMCLIVDRSSAMSRARSVVAIKQELGEGYSIFIYPEGSRNKTDAPLAPFFDGAFRVAVQTGAPIAIQTIANIRAISATTKSIDLRPGIVHVHWEPPIDTKGMGQERVASLKEQVWNTMYERLKSSASK